MIWHDLSSAEIRARLVQRGCNPARARILVQPRERPRAAAEISRRLAA